MNRTTLLFSVLVLSAVAAVQLTTGREPGARQQNAPPYIPRPDKDPAYAINKPDYFAWQLFAYVNAPAPAQTKVMSGGQQVTTNSALWETWASDPDTFPTAPDPTMKPTFPGAERTRTMKLRPRALQHRAPAPKAPEVKELATIQNPGEEVFRNRAAFDYIVNNDLWYTEGIAAFFQRGVPVSFPTDALEIKANWTKIKADDKAKYHWNYDSNGDLYGLVAMHISSKVLPNWFWATFEWVDNPGRSDYLGSRDTFGVVYDNAKDPSVQLPLSTTGTVYPPGKVSPDLVKLFKEAGFKDDWAAQWSNYRLKGSLVDFADSTGRPALLGNSVTEAGFVPSASCITCHSRAAVDSQGKSVFGDGLKPTVSGDNLQSFNGYPDPNWFWQISDDPRNNIRKTMQVDFVWAIPFFAQPAKK